MNYSFISGEAAQASGELLVIPVFEGELGDKSPTALARADSVFEGRLATAAAQEGFKGKAEQSFTLHTLGRLEAERVLLLGLGTRAKYTPEVLRQAAGRAAKTAQRLKVRTAVFALPSVDDASAALRATVEGLELGAYRFDRYKSSSKEEKNAPKLSTVRLALAEGVEKTKENEQLVAQAQRLA